MKQLIHILLNRAGQIFRSATPGQLLIVFSTLLLAGYLAACLPAPGYRLRQLKQMYQADHVPATTGNTGYLPYPEISDLIRQKAWLESRNAMTSSDSIGLVIDLRDSLVALEINGIMLHRCKILDFSTDRFFSALDNNTYAALFSRPLVIEKHHGTLVREPVFVRKAPKDTIEAARNVFMPDTTRHKPAFMTLRLSHGIPLSLEENSKGSAGRSVRQFLYHTINRLCQTGKNIFAILRFRIPAYEPSIRITLPGKDIATIYRALPEKARVALLI